MILNELKHKALILHGLGCRMDDQLEAARAETYRCEGAVGALKQAYDKLEGLLHHVNKDIDEEQMDLEQAAVAKKHIQRCMNYIEHLRVVAETQCLQARGAVAQADKTVKLIKDEHDAAMARVEHIECMKEAGDIEEETIGDDVAEVMASMTEDDVAPARPPGVRPGPTLKEQRNTEAAQDDLAGDNEDTDADDT